MHSSKKHPWNHHSANKHTCLDKPQRSAQITAESACQYQRKQTSVFAIKSKFSQSNQKWIGSNLRCECNSRYIVSIVFVVWNFRYGDLRTLQLRVTCHHRKDTCNTEEQSPQTCGVFRKKMKQNKQNTFFWLWQKKLFDGVSRKRWAIGVSKMEIQTLFQSQWNAYFI